MKATSSPVLPAAIEVEERASMFSVWMELFKARLSGLVVLTTLAGFYVAYQGTMDWVLLFHSVCGTTLLAFGAAALNQRTQR